MNSIKSALLVLITASSGFAADGPARREWKIDDTTREALVYVPAAAKTESTPVVIAFHGHGGGMRQASASFAIHKHWPDAIVIYPQGLAAPAPLVDPNGKLPGWQNRAGELGDRDLKLVDAILADMKKEYHVDAKRIFATGHSHGGYFTYLLWSARGDTFAALAPMAAVAAVKLMPNVKPKPIMHVAGEKDELVKFAWQQRTMVSLRKLNGCDESGQSWEKVATKYSSKNGPPVVTYIYSGGHMLPKDAMELAVEFFKEQKEK